MGNLTFIVPVENKDKFNRNDILKLLKDESECFIDEICKYFIFSSIKIIFALK